MDPAAWLDWAPHNSGVNLKSMVHLHHINLHAVPQFKFTIAPDRTKSTCDQPCGEVFPLLDGLVTGLRGTVQVQFRIRILRNILRSKQGSEQVAFLRYQYFVESLQPLSERAS